MKRFKLLATLFGVTLLAACSLTVTTDVDKGDGADPAPVDEVPADDAPAADDDDSAADDDAPVADEDDEPPAEEPEPEAGEIDAQ